MAGVDIVSDEELGGVMDMMGRIKSATMTYLVSIYIGMIIVGILIYPEHYTQLYASVSDVYTNPVGSIFNMVLGAFSGPNSSYVLTITTGVVISGVAAVLFGTGFTALFAIPLLLIMSIVTFFALPTTFILSSALPGEIKMIYSMIMGGLLLVTVYSFTAGRQ